MTKLNSIQFLRAIAALLVVYDHSMLVQLEYATSWQQNFFHLKQFGCIGVDLFFVISGFIITFVANKYIGPSQGVHFLAKRFCRVNPVYYILSLFVFAIILIQGNPSGSIFDSLLILPISGDLKAYNPLLIVGWTLSFEWLFYLLFFFLILFKARNKAFFLIGIITLLVLCGRIYQPHDFRLIFITNPIMLEFLLGCIISYIYLKVKQIHVFIAFSCLLIGVAGYFYLIIYGFGNVWHYKAVLSGYQSLNRFLLWGIPSSLIVAGCVFLEKNGRFSRLWDNPFALLSGDASYSIYLINLMVLSSLQFPFTKVGTFLPADGMIWLQIIIAVTISIWFYQLVEKPLLQYMYKSWLRDTTSISKSHIISGNKKELATR